MLFAVFLPACPHQEIFPWCNDPANPCPPVSPDYPESAVDDGVGTLAGYACRSLRANGCAEGYRDVRTKRTCFQRLQTSASRVVIPYECVAGARSADAVRDCGTKATLRFRCRMPSVDDPSGEQTP